MVMYSFPLIITVLTIVLNLSIGSNVYASENNYKFVGVYKVKSPNGKIFYIGWSSKGVSIKYSKSGKIKTLIDLKKEDAVASYDENVDKHVEIDKKTLTYYYYYVDREAMSWQSVNCRFVNNKYWLDLICDGAYGGSGVPFYLDWIITYDGKVLNLKQQEKFIKKHKVKYDIKSLKNKLKNLSIAYSGKWDKDFKADSIRIGVDKKGNAILGFLFSKMPSLYGVSDAELKNLVGETLWVKAYPKNAFDTLKAPKYKVERCYFKKKNCPFKW